MLLVEDSNTRETQEKERLGRLNRAASEFLAGIQTDLDEGDLAELRAVIQRLGITLDERWMHRNWALASQLRWRGLTREEVYVEGIPYGLRVYAVTATGRQGNWLFSVSDGRMCNS